MHTNRSRTVKTLALAFLALSLIILTFAGVHAQQKGAQPPTKVPKLAPQDFIEIQQLVYSYSYALDTGADDGYMYADLFATDAVVFNNPTNREKLAAMARAQPHGPEYVRHFLTNVMIQPTADGATGKQYLVVIDIGEGGKPSSIFLGGHYEDVYAKTADGWRFKSRNLVRSKVAVQPAPAAAPRQQ
jgi:hypothetical protein